MGSPIHQHLFQVITQGQDLKEDGPPQITGLGTGATASAMKELGSLLASLSRIGYLLC